MKFFKGLLLVLLGIALGVLGAIGFYYLSIGATDWQVYVEEKLIPNVVFIVSSIASIGVMALPVISKVQASAARFDKATEDVNTTYKNDTEMLDYLTQYKQELNGMMDEFKALRSEIKEYIEPVRKASENTEQIVRMGFGNTEALVRDGIAAAIAKVGEENEQSEEST